jgi:hypothetical protein
MRFASLIPVVLALQVLSGPAPAAESLAVQATGRSVPETCAEKDNVEINFTSPVVRAFKLEAVHPAYIGMIRRDRFQPDYTACDIAPGVGFAAGAQRVTFWETPQFWLTGYRLPEFWRPTDVPVRVGDRVERGLTFIQLWMRYRERAEEILVMYPPDGYWRIRPLPPDEMRWTAYGSSFLVGPVEMAERPIVAIEEIVFDPVRKSFTLRFKRGGSATLSLATIDEDRFWMAPCRAICPSRRCARCTRLRTMPTPRMSPGAHPARRAGPNRPCWRSMMRASPNSGSADATSRGTISARPISS